jgi:hypothetical protein
MAAFRPSRAIAPFHIGRNRVSASIFFSDEDRSE